MDGWTDGWKDGWMDGWMAGWMDGWTDGRMDGWMDGWKDERMDGCLDGRMAGWLGEMNATGPSAREPGLQDSPLLCVTLLSEVQSIKASLISQQWRAQIGHVPPSIKDELPSGVKGG